MNSENLLPYDGVVRYFGVMMPATEANSQFEQLVNAILWQHDEVVIFGKRIKTARRTGWYGDAPFVYRYSGVAKTALPWTDALLSLKSLTEKITGGTFNSSLLNLYDDGSQSMGWHADDEPHMTAGASIASWSFGAERKFSFRHRLTKETVSLTLENGSLLTMEGNIQQHWQHALPKSLRVKAPRVNATFRTFATK